MKAFIFFPSKCLTRQCGNAFVGPGYLCEQCDDARLHATPGELAQARVKITLKRLGLAQQDRPDTGSVGGAGAAIRRYNSRPASEGRA